jgi:hypothetical protein
VSTGASPRWSRASRHGSQCGGTTLGVVRWHPTFVALGAAWGGPVVMRAHNATENRVGARLLHLDGTVCG